MFRFLWAHRGLLRQLVSREVRAKYRATAIGLGWAVLAPLILLAVYALVFGQVFPSKWPQSSDAPFEFALILFAGLLVFTFFSDCVSRAPSLITSSPSYVTKIIFPLPLLAVVSVASSLVQALISLALLGLGLLALGTWHIVWIVAPLVLMPIVMLCLGLSWLLSSLGVYIRDSAPIVHMGTTALLFLSPIFYPLDALPEPLRSWLLLNPLTIPIEALRAVMAFGALPNPLLFATHALVSFLVMVAGFQWFVRTQKGFADVL